MFTQPLVILALAALAFSRALPVAKRDEEPNDWWNGLEDYNVYHTRYLEIGCENKHNTTFFTSCCHPRLKDEDISSIPEECLGSNDVCDGDDGDNSNDTTPTAPMNVEPTPSAPAPSPSPNGGNDSGNNDGGGNGNGNNDNGGDVLTGSGGVGTYFLQNGVAGACGTVHADSDSVVALDSALYGNSGGVSQYCGKTIFITNLNNGKSVTATVADDCPTCDNKNSVDMSVGAFTQIATEAEGQVPIKWTLKLD